MKASVIWKSLTATCVAGLLAACGSSEFAGSNNRPTPKSSNQEPAPQVPPTTDVEPAGGDGGGTSASGERIVQTFIAEDYHPVDVVMLLDTSVSMVDESEALKANMDQFIASLGNSNLDAQITLLAKLTDLTDPHRYGFAVNFNAKDNFKIVDQYIHSVDAIGHLGKFLNGDYGFPLPLRDNSVVEAIIISDDNGSNTIGNAYQVPKNTAAEFKAPAGKEVVINAVVGTVKGDVNSDCHIANVGTEHITLSKNTGGTVIDLCTKDWSALLKKLSDSIASRRLAYDLSHDPNPNLEVVVSVDGKVVDPSNYTIDAATKTLRFNPSYHLPAKAQVKVEYYYTK